MKITLLLAILGVSANTAVSAFDLPEFLRGNNACNCQSSSECSSNEFCDFNTSCNVKGGGTISGKCVSGSGNNGNNNRSGDSCECKYDRDCNGSNSWCDQDVNCSGNEFGSDGGFCVRGNANDIVDECNNNGDCDNDEFCDNQGYCRLRFNGDRANGRVCDYKQCTNKGNQDLCQCNLNNSRCVKGSEAGANTCPFTSNSNENGCCVPGAGANMFLADEIQDQDFGEEE